MKSSSLISPGFRRTAAFTMVEILVAVGIVLVLAGLLFPAFSNAHSGAKRTACATNLKTLGTASALYTAEHDGYVPMMEIQRPWYIFLYYMPQGCLFPYLSGRGENEMTVRCPEAKWSTGYGAFSYTSNYWAWGFDDKPSVKISSIARPSRCMSLADGIKIADNNNGVWDQSQGPAFEGEIFRVGGPHNGKANVLFFDGHVETLPPKEITQEMFDLQ